MAGIYTGSHAPMFTVTAEVTDYSDDRKTIALMFNVDGSDRLHLAGLELHEAETIASELTAAVKRARAQLQAAGTELSP